MDKMVFTDQREYSKRMSRHLDHMKAVGPAETVNIRRLLNFLLLRTNVQGFLKIPAGSKAEGFDFDNSDNDIIVAFQNSIVIQKHEGIPDGDDTVFAMDNTDCRAGYTLLKLLHLRLNEQGYITNALVHFRNLCYLSSVVLLSNMMHSTARLHGPCSMHICSCSKRHETDFAFSFHCRSWPDGLSDFRSRTKYCIWPPDNLVNRIVQGGCHFVAIGDKHSDLFGMQWRISFAKAEKCLVMSFNHVQLKTYALLKIFLKEVIERDRRVKDLLCSYFMKTIVFHAIEHSESFMWVDENLLNCFRFCFTMLLEFVNTGYFPNYFILTNNMFHANVFGRSRRKLLLVLSRYQRMGLTCLNLCPSLVGTLYWATDDNHALVVEHNLDTYVEKMLNAIFKINDINNAIKNVATVLLDPLYDTSHDVELLFLMNSITVESRKVMADLTHTPLSPNKAQYFQIRKQIHRVQISSTVSVCRGHLTLASFYYSAGCYNHVYEAALRVTSLCSQSHEDIIGKGYTQLQKSAQYLCVYCIESSGKDLYPQELKLEVIHSKSRIILQPLPYALFLLVLSSYRIGKVHISRPYFAELLELRTDDNYGETSFPLIHNLIGICHQLLGDTTLALKAFEESYRRFPENMAASKRISDIRENLCENLFDQFAIDELDYCNVRSRCQSSVREEDGDKDENDTVFTYTKVMYNVDPVSFVAMSWF